MAPKVKGLFKKIKCISKIFVYKEPDLEIGYPSDVRHVTHIGWDSASSNAPSWMSQFKSSSDISCEMIEFGSSVQNSWASPDFQRNRGGQFLSRGNGNGCFLPEIQKASKKAKQRKAEAPSPAKSRSSSKASFSTAFDEPDEFSNYMTGKELDEDILNQQTAIC